MKVVRAENKMIMRMLLFSGTANAVIVEDRRYGKKGLMITERAATRKELVTAVHWLLK